MTHTPTPEPTPDPDYYEWVHESPFVTLTVAKEGYALPGVVFRKVLDELATMISANEPDPNMNHVAASFECSHITIGLDNPKFREDYRFNEEPEAYPGYPSDEGWLVVAEWNSGMSTGCTTYLFYNPAINPETNEPCYEWSMP